MIKLNRKKMFFKKGFDDGAEYVDASPGERLSFMWELTQEIWAIKDKRSVKRRLQRNITNFIKK